MKFNINLLTPIILQKQHQTNMEKLIKSRTQQFKPKIQSWKSNLQKLTLIQHGRITCKKTPNHLLKIKIKRQTKLNKLHPIQSLHLNTIPENKIIQMFLKTQRRPNLPKFKSSHKSQDIPIIENLFWPNKIPKWDRKKLPKVQRVNKHPNISKTLEAYKLNRSIRNLKKPLQPKNNNKPNIQK